MRARREFVLGGLLTILFGSGGCVHSQSQTVRLRGCSISGPEARRLIGSIGSPPLFISGHEPVIRSSGNRNLDFALAQTLGMLSQTPPGIWVFR
jgi:hypothetical protein